MKPTKVQEQNFWEWCGLYQSEQQIHTGWWHYPDGSIQHGFPPIDLNNLFKYAVPKLAETKKRIEYSIDFSILDWGKEANHYFAILQGSHQLLGTGEDKDPALALFWAIYKVMEVTNED